MAEAKPAQTKRAVKRRPRRTKEKDDCSRRDLALLLVTIALSFLFGGEIKSQLYGAEREKPALWSQLAHHLRAPSYAQQPTVPADAPASSVASASSAKEGGRCQCGGAYS